MAESAASATLRVGLAQINPRVGDLAHNLAKVEEFLSRAEQAGCDVVVFPELTLSGYPPEDLVLKAGFVTDNRAALEKVAARSGRCAVVVGFVAIAEDEPIEQLSARPPRLFNAAALCANGAVVGVYHKQLLPNYSVFDEARYFAAGHDDATLYDVAGVAVALTICEDIWITDGPVSRARAAGAQLCLNINGSPFDRAKSGVRERTVIERARETSIPIVYVNQVCGQDELVFDGGSVVVDAGGRCCGTRRPLRGRTARRGCAGCIAHNHDAMRCGHRTDNEANSDSGTGCRCGRRLRPHLGGIGTRCP